MANMRYCYSVHDTLYWKRGVSRKTFKLFELCFFSLKFRTVLKIMIIFVWTFGWMRTIYAPSDGRTMFVEKAKWA